MEQPHKGRHAFSYALPIMIPMGISFFFIGLGFGLYATSQGFPWWVPPVLGIVIFAGSMEFVTIGLLMGGFDPLTALMTHSIVNGRHIFYGLSMLTKYVNMGGNGFLRYSGCVMKVLPSMQLRNCRMMLMRNGSIFIYRG